MSVIFGSPTSSRRKRQTLLPKQVSTLVAESSPKTHRRRASWNNSSSNLPNTPNLIPERPSSPSPSSPCSDRFIPSRSTLNLELSHYHLTSSSPLSPSPSRPASPLPETSPAQEEYKSTLEESLFQENSHAMHPSSLSSPAPSARILSVQDEEFSTRSSRRRSLQDNPLSVLYGSPRTRSKTTQPPPRTRKLPEKAEKVLDAPEMADDFYLNLLDWSSTNIISVALGSAVYLWNASSGEIQNLMQTSEEDDMITSVSFNDDGSLLAIGTALADVQLWDVARMKQLRSMTGHMSRVGALAWSGPLLSSGSRDSLIFNHDPRVPTHHISTFEKHTQEVCGLRWSADGSQLASGGNDNLLNVWERGNSTGQSPVFSFDSHSAAVKALAWCPWQTGLLASGGGTADRKLRFWNTLTGTCLNTIDTKSQVCAIQWCKNHKELVSSHGFSQNQLIVWKYPSMTKVGELTGHESRVLHMAQSPDGTQVVSAAADETLRFWKLFEPKHPVTSSLKTKRRTSLTSRTMEGGLQLLEIR